MRNAIRRAAEVRPGGGTANAVDGEMTRTVRVIGLAIAGLVTAALLAGIWKGSTSAHPGTGALV
ncbi:MAG: cytochrome C oxidase assembly protein, partial [Acidithiobacillus sp.]